MKNISIVKRIFMVMFLLVCAQALAITTPRGSNVNYTCHPNEFSAATIAYYDAMYQYNYPNAILISSTSNTYNCHGYAWHMSEGGGAIWIGCGTSTAEDVYWTDGSYNDVSSSYCTKISYSGDHSAIKSTGGYYTSKWGAMPLMKHYPTDCPGGYENPDKYYRRACDIPQEYATIPQALSAAVYSQTVNVNSSHTLSNNSTVPSGITLKIKNGITLTLSGYKITTSSGTITVEAGATLSPNIQRKNSSNTLKGLYPSIASAISDVATNDRIYLGSGSFSENVFMPSYCELRGNGMNSTTLNGDVSFTSKSNSDIWNMTVNGDITVDGGSMILIYNLKAKDVIDLDMGSNHEVYNVTTSNSGYIELYQTEPIINDINSTNSVNYGIMSYEADFTIYEGIYENKSRAVYSIARADADIEDVEFCSNTYDIYAGTSSAIVLWTVGTMSDCPPPVYGDVTLDQDCVACGRMLKAAEEGTNNEYTQPLAAGNSTPEGQEYAELRGLYRSIKKEILEDFKNGVRADRQKYTGKYQQIITGMRQFVEKYPDSEYAKHALKFIAYSYRALDQDNLLGEYTGQLLGDSKYDPLKTDVKSITIPYYIQKQDYETALKTADEIIQSQPESELALSLLYRKGVIYHKYVKDQDKAAEIYRQVIETDPQSAMAFSANRRLSKLGKEYNQKQINKSETGLKFAVSNFPNPFNPTTSIKFTLPENGYVTLKIYDIQGREVVTLVDAERQVGSHNIVWNSRDKFGMQVASGMYFYRIQYNGQVLTNKMILMR